MHTSLSPRAPAAGGGLCSPAGVVLLAGISAAVHLGKLPPAVPALRSALGITWVQAGFLLSLVQAAAMALGVVAGLMAEHIGLRRSVLCGLVLLSAGSFLGGWATGATALLALRAVEGMGVLLVTVPAPALIRQHVAPQRSARMLGWWGGYMPLGTAFALLAGPFVIARIGWSGWWWVAAACSTLMVPAVWWAVAPDAPPHASPAAGTSPRVRWPVLLRDTLRARGPWLVALCFATYAAQWLAVVGFLPTLYAQAGWSGPRVALLSAGVAVVNVVGNVAAGHLLSRGTRPSALLYRGFAAMAVGSWLAFSAATADHAVLRYAGALLFSAAGGLVPGTLFVLAPTLAPGPRTTSTTVGWMLQWAALGQVCGPPLAAAIATRAGGWHWTWVFAAACSLFGALLATRMTAHGPSAPDTAAAAEAP